MALAAPPEEIFAADKFPAEDELTVGRVFFKGNHALDDDDIIERLEIARRPWSVWGSPQPFNRESLRDDVIRIENIYKKAGYYSARVVDLEVEFVPGDKSVDVTFVVREGRPVVVRDKLSVVYPGASADEVGAIEDLNPLKLGDVFSVTAYDFAQNTIRAKLRSEGFYSAEVTNEAWVYPDEYAAVVTFSIEAGPRVRFGQTVLRGNQAVTENVILREVEWKEGEWWNATAVERTIQDLYGTNLFRRVRIEPRYPGAATDPMPVVLSVTEAQFQALRFGLGYGTEDRLRAQARYEHFNLIGGARRLDLLLRYSSLQKSIEATFVQPYLFSKHNSFSYFTALRRQTVVDAFSADRYVMNPRFNRRITRLISGSIGYRLEYNRAFDVQSGIPLSDRSSIDPGWLSGAELRLERISVDSLLDPTVGNITRINWLQAGQALGGRFDFYKWTLESLQYVHPFRRAVVALRAKAGVARAYSESRVPIYEKFFAGGSNSVRGYRQDRLGPQIGGRTLVEGSAEVRRRVYGDFWAAGFVDMGMVGLKEYAWEQNQVRWGVGPGMRLSTLLGLARLDLGIPLEPRVDEPRWRIHLSIGQAF